MTVRVRFAPSPTGDLHLGGLRTAAYNALFARKHGGRLLLRIEDTDKNRTIPGSVDRLVRDLDWAGIRFDEGPHLPAGAGNSYAPYRQSENMGAYQAGAQALLNSGSAYKCFCTADRLKRMRTEQANMKGRVLPYDRHCLGLSKTEVQALEEQRTPYTVRLKVPAGLTRYTDLIHGTMRFQNSVIDDQILLKSDGFPTYHLANVLDDHRMRVTHVIRGEEWLSSTPKHLMLYRALNLKAPEFAHVPLLLNPDGSKLSKRHGDVHVGAYRDTKLVFPEVLLNFVVMLGWRAGGDGSLDPNVLRTWDELVDMFDLSSIGIGGVQLDPDRLRKLSKHHLQKMCAGENGVARLTAFARDKLPPLRDFDPAYVERVVRALQTRMDSIADIQTLGQYFFHTPDYHSEAAQQFRARIKLDGNAYALMLGRMREDLKAMRDGVSVQALAEWMERAPTRYDLKPGQFKMALRFALTGQAIGAGLPDVIDVLGIDRSLQRIDALHLALPDMQNVEMDGSDSSIQKP